ncbi:SCO-spondin-like isoform X2 [Mya arenaria]|uniref:SCO-spondin-like isoform X2 n=1 Tax=Mya arenaria TaxID=6604 RepID=UPI0022E70944|nr:SCO-spondin-like isoform X2 [Mya arenaria]
MATFITVIALLLLFISKNTVSGISCLHCGNGVSDLAYCNRIVECPANEICYVEQYWLSKDTVAQYRAGCMPIQECEASKCQNKTSGGHDRACMECCYGDRCNIKGCNSSIDGKDGTVLNCYDCDGLQSNDHCSTVTSCPRDNEMCLFQHFPATQTFNVKCVKIAHCKVLDTAYEHVEPENRAAHCCNTTLCNWQQPGENTTVPKPADGAWSNWLPWTQCDVTCGHGNRQRSRTCSNPAPSKCGLDCVGNTTETGDCAGTACPAFWMEWANSNCPVTCGVGNVWRMRACSTGNDADCPGDFGEFYACDEGPCDVDGAWSNWLSWTQCDVTCGHGYRQRLRNCSNPEPSDGGLDCVGNVTETGDCSGTACPAFWLEWANTNCPVTCGVGHVWRMRLCSTGHDADCIGDFGELHTCDSGPCAVDGGWEVWNDWSNCDVTCGHGHKQRTRTCSNPTPAHGGHNCTGKDAETASCNLEKCPVDGGWEIWGDWSNCDVTCGHGNKQRIRNCSNPTPAYGGHNCIGIESETTSCDLAKCPVWSPWFDTGCSKTCDNGTKTRVRHCSSGHSEDCSGKFTETVHCFERHCAVHGGWDLWVAWTNCDVTCGHGYKQRARNCSNPSPAYGGNNCTGGEAETAPCQMPKCPAWSSWFETSCSVTCGNGTKTRVRHCSTGHSEDCPGNSTGVIDCFEQHCPVNGKWATWVNWSSCDVTCGHGSRERTRTCSNPQPLYGGLNCTGDEHEIESCTMKICPAWTSWFNGACSVTCGNGTMTRMRHCNTGHREDCPGHFQMTVDCYKPHCPVAGNWSEWVTWSTCSATCNGGLEHRNRSCSNPAPQYGGQDCVGNGTESKTCFLAPCPVAGNWGEWVTWSTCSATCNGGLEHRNRSCSNPAPQFGGHDCVGNGTESKTCFLAPCPVAGNWGEWVTWSTCSATCNGGMEHRNRSCSNPAPQFGGHDCVGNGTESKTCFLAPCPVAGNWGEWVTWSTCSATCNGGMEHRNRSCSNPAPQFGGHDCVGNGTESKTCFLAPCPVAGNWGEWVTWSTCSATCNGGLEHRHRSCSNPSPQYGGQDCDGNGTESKTCFLTHCPVAGNWSEWVTWSTCSASCNGGLEHRNRSCSNPAPQYGGQDCDGNGTESKTCFLTHCAVDGQWSEWNKWSACDVTCEGGHKHRTRSCTQPPPSYDGQNCTDEDNQTSTCTLSACPTWSDWFKSGCDVTCGTGTESFLRVCSSGHDEDCYGDAFSSHECYQLPCGPYDEAVACTFDTMCNWGTVDTGDAADSWALEHGTDHTNNSGSFISIGSSTSVAGTNSHGVRLRSPKLPPTDPSGNCLHFWYKLDAGVGDQSLNIYKTGNVSTTESSLWVSRNAGKNTWLLGQADITAHQDYFIIIEGTLSQTTKSISLDDVLMTSGACPQSGLVIIG